MQLAELVDQAPDVGVRPLGLVGDLPANLLQLRPHLPQVREALGRILAQGPLDGGGQVRGDRGVDLGQRGRVLRPELLERLHRIIGIEGRPIGQELVEDRSCRELVRALVHAAPRLLGRHVAEGAHDQAGSREPGVGGGDAGDAEVEDLHLPVAQDEDVPRLDVAVDDPVLMGVVEPVADLDHQGQLVLERDLAALADEELELLAVEELHDDEEATLVLAQVVDDDDVRVVEAGAGLGFPVESGLQLVGDLRFARDHLERDEPIEDRVVGLVDGAHPAAADALDDPVLPDLLDHGPASIRDPGTRRRRVPHCAKPRGSTRLSVTMFTGPS